VKEPFTSRVMQSVIINTSNLKVVEGKSMNPGKWHESYRIYITRSIDCARQNLNQKWYLIKQWVAVE